MDKEKAAQEKAEPAFVTLALRRTEGTYSAYFGTLKSIGFVRCVPMLPNDRHLYETLADDIKEPEVAALI